NDVRSASSLLIGELASVGVLRSRLNTTTTTANSMPADTRVAGRSPASIQPSDRQNGRPYCWWNNIFTHKNSSVYQRNCMGRARNTSLVELTWNKTKKPFTTAMAATRQTRERPIRTSTSCQPQNGTRSGGADSAGSIGSLGSGGGSGSGSLMLHTRSDRRPAAAQEFHGDR